MKLKKWLLSLFWHFYLVIYHKFKLFNKIVSSFFNLDDFIFNFNLTRINMQGDFFLKINKRADSNKAMQGEIFFSKLINMQAKYRAVSINEQGEIFLKINKRACTSIRHTRVWGPWCRWCKAWFQFHGHIHLRCNSFNWTGTVWSQTL